MLISSTSHGQGFCSCAETLGQEAIPGASSKWLSASRAVTWRNWKIGAIGAKFTNLISSRFIHLQLLRATHRVMNGFSARHCCRDPHLGRLCAKVQSTRIRTEGQSCSNPKVANAHPDFHHVLAATLGTKTYSPSRLQAAALHFINKTGSWLAPVLESRSKACGCSAHTSLLNCASTRWRNVLLYTQD